MTNQYFRMGMVRIAIVLTLSGLFAEAAGADDVLRPLRLGQVKVGGEIGRRIGITVQNNLLVLSADAEFLRPFQEKTRTSGYIGLGKLIDATIRFAAYTGDDKVVALKKHLVERAIDAQEPDGYIGMLAVEHRMWGMWDIHEMAYLIYALCNDYTYFGQQRSLDAARKAADYILDRWAQMPADWDAQTGIATHVSVTGLERALLTLARVGKDDRYLEFVVNQRALPQWDLGLVIGRRPLIEGHIYAYLCRCLAQLELYRSTPDDRLLQPTRRVIQFLTRGGGMTITGGCGQWEAWTDDQDGRGALGETCATAYQVRIFDSLLRLGGESRYGDLMERTIFNALFAAQSPDGRQIRYYTPFEGARAYHPGDTYCCPCNYRRIIAELPAMVYYQDDHGIAINLYTPSQAELELPGGVKLAIRQETDYPNSGRVVIRIEPSQATQFTLRLRIPAWCDTAKVAVNGVAYGQARGGDFFPLKRVWQAEDQVVLEMPMRWRLVRGQRRQAGRVAVMRGPLVFCLNPVQSDRLADRDGSDLGQITLDPESLAAPVADASVRPAGQACPVRGWAPGYATKQPGDLSLELTEFTDPSGRAVYFRLQDPASGVRDRLLTEGVAEPR